MRLHKSELKSVHEKKDLDILGLTSQIGRLEAYVEEFQQKSENE